MIPCLGFFLCSNSRSACLGALNRRACMHSRPRLYESVLFYSRTSTNIKFLMDIPSTNYKTYTAVCCMNMLGKKNILLETNNWTLGAEHSNIFRSLCFHTKSCQTIIQVNAGISGICMNKRKMFKICINKITDLGTYLSSHSSNYWTRRTVILYTYRSIMTQVH